MLIHIEIIYLNLAQTQAHLMSLSFLENLENLGISPTQTVKHIWHLNNIL